MLLVCCLSIGIAYRLLTLLGFYCVWLLALLALVNCLVLCFDFGCLLRCGLGVFVACV